MIDRILLLIITICGIYECYILTKEYKYDEEKDLSKKQRKTRTTKKTTKSIDGSVTEESSEETIGPAENK